MVTEENQEEEFIIPTKYKTPIGSYLSWPVGAAELTKAFLDVPQLKDIELRFSEHYPKYPKGKWPPTFRVIEVRYAYDRIQHAPIAGTNPHWYLDISPVPRKMRAEIRQALNKHGFNEVAEWLTGHADIFGHEGNLSYMVAWNSESKGLSFGSRDYILPKVSEGRQPNAK